MAVLLNCEKLLNKKIILELSFFQDFIGCLIIGNVLILKSLTKPKFSFSEQDFDSFVLGISFHFWELKDGCQLGICPRKFSDRTTLG